jgi:predicted enzyme related to lactoylglutathione lyase
MGAASNATQPAQINNPRTSSMKIKLTSVMVNDQEKAFRFYTDILGFVKKQDLPAGNERWLTVVSPAGQDNIELLLEPMGFPPARTYQKALYDAGIPLASFSVEDLEKQFERIVKLGGTFTVRPTDKGPTRVAVVDDTCGNLIQLLQPPRFANGATNSAIKISLASVLVNDQENALEFYTRTLGFLKKRDMPAGTNRWLTVVSPEEPEGPELLLEPMGFAPAKTFQKALFDAGIPLTAFAVDDIQLASQKLKKSGVMFKMEPTKAGPTTLAVFEDTCGNLIQIFQK